MHEVLDNVDGGALDFSCSTPVGNEIDLAVQHPAGVLESIAFHEQERIRLSRLYNTLVAVNRLPSDVLSTIFSAVVCLYHSEVLQDWSNQHTLPEDATHQPLYAWTRLLHVCLHWRQVALQCPTLWNFLFTSERVPLELLELFATRSQTLPLSVNMQVFEREGHCHGCMRGDPIANRVTNLLFVRQHLFRVRKLTVCCGLLNSDPIWGVFNGDASSMKTLKFELSQSLSYVMHCAHGQMSAIPENTFALRVPPLERLTLRGVKTHWAHPLFCSTLRHLEVSSSLTARSVQEGGALELSELMSTLQRMPLLETLKLSDLPIVSPSFRHEIIALSRLKSMHIPLKEATGHLLTHLRIPEAASLEFTTLNSLANISMETREAFREGFRALLKGASPYELSYESCFEYTSLEKSCIRIYEQTVALPQTNTASVRPCRDPSRADTAVRMTFQGDLSDAMASIVHFLDLSVIRSLDLDGDLEDSRRWLDVLRGAQNVTTIRLRGDLAFTVGAALADWDPRTFIANMDQDKASGNRPRPRQVFDETTIFLRNSLRYGQVPEDAEDSGEAREKGDRKDGTGPGTPASLPFPKLSVLRFSSVDFPIEVREVKGVRLRRARHRSSIAMIRWSLAVPSGHFGLDAPGLAKALRLRAARGVSEVVCLEFDSCQCYERERLLPLVKAVPEVLWDGVRLTVDSLGTQKL